MSNLVFNKQTRLDGREIGQCTAYTLFDGRGVPSIRGGMNILGITDIGTGIYQLQFENDLDNTNYTIVGFAGAGNARFLVEYNGTLNASDSTTARTVSSCMVRFLDSAGNSIDDGGVNVAIFGGIS